MRLSSDAVQALIGTAYEAAAQPSLWDSFLRRLRQTTQSSQACLLLHDLKSNQYAHTAQIDLDPESQRLYAEYYGAKDEWFLRGKGILRTGWVGTSQMLCPDKDLIKTEFFDGLLNRFDIFHQCGAIVSQEASRSFAVSLLRSKKTGAFGLGHVRLLRVLLPHLQRAYRLHYHITDLRLRTTVMEQALDRWSTGVILMDRSAKVVFLNRTASTLIAQKDGLLLGRDGLTAASPRDAERLGRLIRAALSIANGNGKHPAGAIQINRLRCLRPLTLLVTPFKSEALIQMPGSSVVAILISDPDGEVRLREEVLGDLYGLTASETSLAELLASGKSLKEAAEVRSVTEQTARSQLKSIFSKTSTRRQSELVRLLLSLPA